MFENKRILVTGGTGMIGRQLVDLLADRVRDKRKVIVVSMDNVPANNKVITMKADLRNQETCAALFDGVDYVFHLAGIKGSPKICRERPATFMTSMLQFNTNVISSAAKLGVEKFLYTSSVGVYAPAEIMEEDSVWKTFPSPNDRFAGWAKRMGELQCEALRQEGSSTKFNIVRPTNIYGTHDNFDPENAMVIPSLISRAMSGENPLVVWGDGSAIRDFCYSSDCARAMIHIFENGIEEPINIGGPRPVSIKEIAEIVVKEVGKGQEIVWDTSKPSGDKKRILDSSKLVSSGFKHEVQIDEGIHRVVEWFKKNGPTADRYNVFKE